MQVEVRLYGSLRRHRPAAAAGAAHQPFTVTLPDGATVDALVALLHIPDGLASAAAVNDDAVTTDAALSDGDRVALFPPAGGGESRARPVDAAPHCP